MVNTMHKTRGFTLIEVMVAVAVIAVLASIAFPSYQEAVRKSKRAEGKVAVLEALQQQERYATNFNTYLPFSAGADALPIKTYSGTSGKDSAAFLIKADACDNQTIDICVVVTGVPTYSDPKVSAISITSSGVKNCNGTSSTECWK